MHIPIVKLTVKEMSENTIDALQLFFVTGTAFIAICFLYFGFQSGVFWALLNNLFPGASREDTFNFTVSSKIN